MLAFLVACMLLGGMIGFIAGSISDAPEEDEIVEEVELQPIGVVEGNVELAIGAATAVMLVYIVLNADKNGSRLFLPADAAILFQAPMKPQNVLLFRLMTKVGLWLFICIYVYIFALPLLLGGTGLGLITRASLMGVLLLIFALGSILQVFMYTWLSNHPSYKRYVRYGMYGLLLLCVGSFIVQYTQGSGSAFESLRIYLNAPWTHYIPVWGWLKLMGIYAVHEQYGLFFVFFALNLIVILALVYGIWHIKADFYEEALQSSQEMAAMLEKVQTENKLVVLRQKERSDHLVRNAFHKGSGASVYFYKTMYNRFRFAKFGIFTKTAGVYLVASIVMIALDRFVWQTKSVYASVIVFAVIAFIRSLGDGLYEDMSRAMYRLIPVPAYQKLAYSILASACNFFLDLVPGVILVAIFYVHQLPVLVLSILLIVSVYMFGTITNTLIQLLMPENVSSMVKQMGQVFFLYFGFVPDASLLGYGFYVNQIEWYFVIALCVNVFLCITFGLLTAVLLEPSSKTEVHVVKMDAKERKGFKRAISTVGLMGFAFLLTGSIAQIVAMILFPTVDSYILTFIPLYLVGMPCTYLVSRRVKPMPRAKHTLNARSWIEIVFVMIFMMVIGSLVGNIVTSFIAALLDKGNSSGIGRLVDTGSILQQFIFLCVCAPIFEELIFRKWMMDRLVPYGEVFAIVMTGVMFGLFHGNFSQFFYTMTVGFVWGYVYLKSGKIQYSILLHMAMNIMGSLFVSHVSEVVLSAYQIFLYVGALIGMVIFVSRMRTTIRFESTTLQVSGKMAWKTVCTSVGMILFFLMVVALFAISIIGM